MHKLTAVLTWPFRACGSFVGSVVDDSMMMGTLLIALCVYFAHRAFGIDTAIVIGVLMLYIRLTVKGRIV